MGVSFRSRVQVRTQNVTTKRLVKLAISAKYVYTRRMRESLLGSGSEGNVFP